MGTGFDPEKLSRMMNLQPNNESTEDLGKNPIPSLNDLKIGIDEARSTMQMLEEIHNKSKNSMQEIKPSDDSPISDVNMTETFNDLKREQVVDLLKQHFDASITFSIPPNELQAELEYMKHLKPHELVERMSTLVLGANKLAIEGASNAAYVESFRHHLKLPTDGKTQSVLSNAIPQFLKESILGKVIALAAKKEGQPVQEFTNEEIESIISFVGSKSVESGKMKPTIFSASTRGNNNN